MFIGLDGFKSLNDTYGHDTGDSVLKEVADKILDTIKKKVLVSGENTHLSASIGISLFPDSAKDGASLLN